MRYVCVAAHQAPVLAHEVRRGHRQLLVRGAIQEQLRGRHLGGVGQVAPGFGDYLGG